MATTLERLRKAPPQVQDEHSEPICERNRTYRLRGDQPKQPKYIETFSDTFWGRPKAFRSARIFDDEQSLSFATSPRFFLSLLLPVSTFSRSVSPSFGPLKPSTSASVGALPMPAKTWRCIFLDALYHGLLRAKTVRSKPITRDRMKEINSSQGGE